MALSWAWLMVRLCKGTLPSTVLSSPLPRGKRTGVCTAHFPFQTYPINQVSHLSSTTIAALLEGRTSKGQSAFKVPTFMVCNMYVTIYKLLFLVVDYCSDCSLTACLLSFNPVPTKPNSSILSSAYASHLGRGLCSRSAPERVWSAFEVSA